MNDTTAVATQAASAQPPTPWTEKDAFELALRRAKVYAASTLVPAQYQDNLPNCLIAINMAKRIGADELQVMQNLYIVHGKPGWSGQFLIATFNQCGRFSALRFEWRGEGKTRACRAYATEKASGERIEGTWVTWEMVEAEGWSKKAGSKWLTMPEQMFAYRAAAFLVRTHAPEIAMGLQTVEELREVIDIEPEPALTKTDAVTAALRQKLAAPDAPVPTPAIEAAPPLALESTPPIPALTFAEVQDAINKATTTQVLDILEADQIPQVANSVHRAELRAAAKKRMKELAL